MTTKKPRRSNNLHLLDGQQRQALGQFAKDAQKVLPHMQAAAEAAKTLHRAMIDTPIWRIADGEKPDAMDPDTQPKQWTVGHAEVNYVDHIETKSEGAQQK